MKKGTQYLWVNIEDVSITSTTVMRIRLSKAEYFGGIDGVPDHFITFGVNIVGYDNNGEVYWSYLPEAPSGVLGYYGWNTYSGGTPFEKAAADASFPVFELVRLPAYGNKDPAKIVSWDVVMYGAVESFGTVYSKWEISGIDFGDVRQNKQQNNKIDHLQETIMTLSDAKSTIKIKIPANTFNKPVGLEIKSPSFYPSVKDTSMKALSLGVEIISEEQLPSGKEIEITIEYKPESVPNSNKSNFVVARYDETINDWKVLISQNYPSENKIVARTDHLSIFQVFEMKATSDFNRLYVYPNPYKPGANNNEPWFGNSTLGEGVVFKNLTAKASIKIYNIAGELVAELEETDGNGMHLWNTRNENGSGAKVASGVYIYYVTNPDNTSAKPAKGRFAIIR